MNYTPQSLDELEKKGIELFNKAFQKNYEFDDRKVFARRSVESLIKNLIRRNIENADTSRFDSMVKVLAESNVVPEHHRTSLNYLWKESSKAVHGLPNTEDYLAPVLIILTNFFQWYFEVYLKTKLNSINFKQIKDFYKEYPFERFYSLLEKREISQNEFGRLMKKKYSKKADKKKKGNKFKTPVYALFLIDDSYSMISDVEDVIEAHRGSIGALRGSFLCRNKRLQIIQYLFNGELTLLNSLEELSKDGDDNVAELNLNTYRPSGCTALYDSLETSLTDLLDEIIAVKGRAPKLHIGLITDGEDTCSKNASAEVVKELINGKLRKHLVKAVLIGLTDSGRFSESSVAKLKDDLGFDTYFSIDKENPKSIREAFDLWSQSVVELK